MEQNTLYTAIGRLDRETNGCGRSCPVIRLGGQTYMVDMQEMVVWTALNWRISKREDISLQCDKLVSSLGDCISRSWDACVNRLLTRGLLVSGCGETEYDALYDLLSSLGIIPASGSMLMRSISFVKLVAGRRVPIQQALKLFQKDRRTDYETRVMRLAQQALLSTAEIIKCVEQDVAYGKYADSVRYFHDSTMAWWSQCWLWNAAARAVLPSTLLGTLPVGAWLYMEGSLSLPVFLVALVVPLGFIAPLMKVSEAMEQVSMIKGNLEQVTAFLKTPELVRPTKPAELGERRYQFEDVHFAYNEAEVLHGISFQTQPGTMTAIVGPSGSGKSTIAKLMAGFWDVTSGTVRFGGQDIRNIPFGQLMGEISYVAQDNFLFDKSIRENIRMGNPNASDGEVEAAAKAANCHDFIMQLEQGYDTMAGDAGDRLSGGERQRITIARAMLKQASVIILDEATAYADPENEALIQQAISKLVAGKSLIVVAHRLNTIRNADQILVVANGEIVGRGIQEELLENCPLYRKMWQDYAGSTEGGVEDV